MFLVLYIKLPFVPLPPRSHILSALCKTPFCPPRSHVLNAVYQTPFCLPRSHILSALCKTPLCPPRSHILSALCKTPLCPPRSHILSVLCKTPFCRQGPTFLMLYVRLPFVPQDPIFLVLYVRLPFVPQVRKDSAPRRGRAPSPLVSTPSSAAAESPAHVTTPTAANERQPQAERNHKKVRVSWKWRAFCQTQHSRATDECRVLQQLRAYRSLLA